MPQSQQSCRGTSPTPPRLMHQQQKPFLQQEEQHSSFRHWIYPEALAEKGKEKGGGRKKKNQVLIFKMSKLMWKSQMVNKYGAQNCHLAASSPDQFKRDMQLSSLVQGKYILGSS